MTTAGETPRRGRAVWREIFSGILLTLAFALFCYLGSACVVFDFTQTAQPFDEEYRNGQPVALGPRPHWWLCQPTYHNWFYDGREWPFHVYRPLCLVWLKLHGEVDYNTR